VFYTLEHSYDYYIETSQTSLCLSQFDPWYRLMADTIVWLVWPLSQFILVL